MNGKV